METIYKITSPSGKIYIGRTKSLESRMAQHKYEAKSGRKDQVIHIAIRKYGWENMEVEVLAKAPSSEIKLLEEHFIKNYDAVNIGYNSSYNTTRGGDQWEGRKDTEEYKAFTEKMSGITSGENNGMYGRKHSEETRAKMTAKAAGRCSLEWFINKHGQVEGTERYEGMMEKRRKNRYAKMKTDGQGKFVG